MYLSTVPTNGMVIHKSKVWNECITINSNLNIAAFCIADIKCFRPLVAWTEHQFKLIYRVAFPALEHIPN